MTNLKYQRPNWTNMWALRSLCTTTWDTYHPLRDLWQSISRLGKRRMHLWARRSLCGTNWDTHHFQEGLMTHWRDGKLQICTKLFMSLTCVRIFSNVQKPQSSRDAQIPNRYVRLQFCSKQVASGSPPRVRSSTFPFPVWHNRMLVHWRIKTFQPLHYLQIEMQGFIERTCVIYDVL